MFSKEAKMFFSSIPWLIGVIYGCVIYYDIRYRMIPDVLIILLLGLNYFFHPFTKENLLCAFSVGIGAIFLKKGMEVLLKRPALGWGDVKLVSALAIEMTVDIISFFLISVGVIGILWGIFYKIIFKESTFPFAPSLILGFLFVNEFF
jgi:Flp pilus assembly protein protease CpaA